MASVRSGVLVLAAALLAACGSTNKGGSGDASDAPAAEDSGGDEQAAGGDGGAGQPDAGPSAGDAPAALDAPDVDAASDAMKASDGGGMSPDVDADAAPPSDGAPRPLDGSPIDSAAEGACSPIVLTPTNPPPVQVTPAVDPNCAANGVTLTTDMTSYPDVGTIPNGTLPSPASIRVTFMGLRGVNDDLLVLDRVDCPQGPNFCRVTSQPKDPVTGAYLTAGTKTFAAYDDGTYVIRYSSSGGTQFCRSAPFTVYTPAPTTVSPDKSAYLTGQVISVTWTNIPNVGVNVIQIVSPCAAADAKPVQWEDFNWPSSSGYLQNPVRVFTAPDVGTYVLRAVSGSPPLVWAQSAPFTVSARPAVTPTISTDKAIYSINDTITVSYAGLPGNKYDVIRVATPSQDYSSLEQEAITNGKMSGTVTFKAASLLGPGSYVARAGAEPRDVCGDAGADTCGHVALAQSAVFTVTN